MASNAELLLPVASGLLWTFAYVAIIRASIHDRTFGIPALAAALNVSWEAVYFAGGVAYWDRYDLDTHVQTVINGIWLLLDIAILAVVVRYLKSEIRFRIHIPTSMIMGAALACAFAFQISILLAMDAQSAARLSAFTQNAFMSGAFVLMVLTRGPEGQRRVIAVTKLLGTLAATISAGIIGNVVPSILLLGVTCVVLDVFYVRLLGMARAAGSTNGP